MCEICGREAVDDRGFCAMHLARWLQFAYLMPWRHATPEGVREHFIKWQRGE